MKVYVTKYFATKGIVLVDAEATSVESMLSYVEGNGYRGFLHKGDYVTTEEDARNAFNNLKSKKLKSLERSLSKIKQMEFNVTEGL